VDNGLTRLFGGLTGVLRRVHHAAELSGHAHAAADGHSQSDDRCHDCLTHGCLLTGRCTISAGKSRRFFGLRLLKRLDSAVEVMLWAYAYGKPIEHVEHTGMVSLRRRASRVDTG
jgi:hypothetical protein